MADFIIDREEGLKELNKLSKYPYKKQAIWFLNAFWKQEPVLFCKNNEHAEMVWKYKENFVEFDPLKEEGNELDEFYARRVLEVQEEAVTMKEMRDAMAAMDIDFNNKVSLVECLIFHFKVDWMDLFKQPQKGNPVKMNHANRLLRTAVNALDSAISARNKAIDELKQSSEAAARAKLEAERSKEKEEEARQAEDDMKAAKEEQEANLLMLQKDEEDLLRKKEELKKTSEDEENYGPVKRNKAKAELAQLEAQDPLPIIRGRIQQEFKCKAAKKALKKSTELSKQAEESRAKAEAAKVEAEVIEAKAQKSVQYAEDSVHICEDAIKEAQEYLDQVKEEYTGSSDGELWWLDRELEAARKYLPKKKIAQLEKKVSAQKDEMKTAAASEGEEIATQSNALVESEEPKPAERPKPKPAEAEPSTKATAPKDNITPAVVESDGADAVAKAPVPVNRPPPPPPPASQPSAPPSAEPPAEPSAQPVAEPQVGPAAQAAPQPEQQPTQAPKKDKSPETKPNLAVPYYLQVGGDANGLKKAQGGSSDGVKTNIVGRTEKAPWRP